MSEIKLQQGTPAQVGLCELRWNRVLASAAELCRSRQIPAISLQVQKQGWTTGPHHFGTQNPGSQTPIEDHTPFLVASLTKPMVAAAILLLVERGELALNQPVHEFLPELRDAAKRSMTIKHLLTHTSGLPDMLPDNEQLRKTSAPLSQFVTKTCQVKLNFPPGRNAQYQSMGYALLGAIIEAVSGTSCRNFLQEELFAPLQMRDSWLGLPADPALQQRVAVLSLSEPMQSEVGWNWNSRYWRELGAPWGGVFSTASDLSRFLRMMLLGGMNGKGHGLLSPATLQDAVGNRLHDYPSIPDAERRTRGWGLGWRLNWKDHRFCFSDLLPAETVGHWGATGTLFWMDRRREIGAVLLGTLPLNDHVSPLTKLSNMIAAALIE